MRREYRSNRTAILQLDWSRAYTNEIMDMGQTLTINQECYRNRIKEMREHETAQTQAFHELWAITVAGLGHCQLRKEPNTEGKPQAPKRKRKSTRRRRKTGNEKQKKRKKSKEYEAQKINPKPRRELTNKVMHAINGNMIHAITLTEDDKNWCTDALQTLQHAIEENKWAIDNWELSVARIELYLEENHFDEDRRMELLPERHRTRNQQTKEHIHEYKHSKDALQKLIGELRNNARRLALTKDRLMEVIDPHMAPLSALVTIPHKPSRKNPDGCAAIQAAKNPLWSYFSQAVGESWTRVEKARLKANNTRQETRIMFQTFGETRNNLRLQLGQVLPQEWNKSQTNALLDQAVKVTKSRNKYAKEWQIHTQEQKRHNEAFRELRNIAESQLGTIDITENLGQSQASQDNDENPRRRTQKARSTKRKKKRTNKEIRAENGNGKDQEGNFTPANNRNKSKPSRNTKRSHADSESAYNNIKEPTTNITPTAPWLGTNSAQENQEPSGKQDAERLFLRWVPSRGADCNPCPKCGEACLAKFRPPHMLQDCECKNQHHWAGPGTTGKRIFEQNAKEGEQHYTGTPMMWIPVSESQTSIRWPKTKDRLIFDNYRQTAQEGSVESREENQYSESTSSTANPRKRLSWSGASSKSEDPIEDSEDSQLWWCSGTHCLPRNRVLSKNEQCRECHLRLKWESEAHIPEQTDKRTGENPHRITRLKRNKTAHIQNGNTSENPIIQSTQEALLIGNSIDAQGIHEHEVNGKPWINQILSNLDQIVKRNKRDIKDLQQELARRNRATITHPAPTHNTADKYGDEPFTPLIAMPEVSRGLKSIIEENKKLHFHKVVLGILQNHTFQMHEPNDNLMALTTLDEIGELNSQDETEKYELWEQTHFELIYELRNLNIEHFKNIREVNHARGDMEDTRQQIVAQFQLQHAINPNTIQIYCAEADDEAAKLWSIHKQERYLAGRTKAIASLISTNWENWRSRNKDKEISQNQAQSTTNRQTIGQNPTMDWAQKIRVRNRINRSKHEGHTNNKHDRQNKNETNRAQSIAKCLTGLAAIALGWHIVGPMVIGHTIGSKAAAHAVTTHIRPKPTLSAVQRNKLAHIKQGNTKEVTGDFAQSKTRLAPNCAPNSLTNKRPNANTSSQRVVFKVQQRHDFSSNMTAKEKHHYWSDGTKWIREMQGRILEEAAPQRTEIKSLQKTLSQAHANKYTHAKSTQKLMYVPQLPHTPSKEEVEIRNLNLSARHDKIQLLRKNQKEAYLHGTALGALLKHTHNVWVLNTQDEETGQESTKGSKQGHPNIIQNSSKHQREAKTHQRLIQNFRENKAKHQDTIIHLIQAKQRYESHRQHTTHKYALQTLAGTCIAVNLYTKHSKEEAQDILRAIIKEKQALNNTKKAAQALQRKEDQDKRMGQGTETTMEQKRPNHTNKSTNREGSPQQLVKVSWATKYPRTKVAKLAAEWLLRGRNRRISIKPKKQLSGTNQVRNPINQEMQVSNDKGACQKGNPQQQSTNSTRGQPKRDAESTPEARRTHSTSTNKCRTKKRIKLTNRFMRATHGNGAVPDEMELDRIWCEEAIASLSRAAYHIEWQIIGWRNNIDHATRFLEVHHHQEERELDRAQPGPRPRNQQTKEHIAAIRDAKAPMLRAHSQLNIAFERIKLTRARILETLNPNTTHLSVLNNHTDEDPQQKEVQHQIITQEKNPIWHHMVRTASRAYNKAQEQGQKTRERRKIVQKMFAEFRLARTTLRRIRPLGGVAEWSSMHSNSLMDLAGEITKEHNNYTDERNKFHKAVAQYHAAHEDAVAMVIAQLGTTELNGRSQTHNQAPKLTRTGPKTKRRKRTSRRSRRQKGPTTKETHILHGNTSANAWWCKCGQKNPAILTRCTNRQCGKNKETDRITPVQTEYNTNDDTQQRKSKDWEGAIQQAKNFKNTLWIHVTMVSQFRGRRGTNIRSLGEKYKVKISVNTVTPVEGYCEITVTGFADRKLEAESHIKRWINSESRSEPYYNNEQHGKEQGWTCRNCEYHNWGTRDKCGQCYKTPPSNQATTALQEPQEDPWKLTWEEEQEANRIKRRKPQKGKGQPPIPDQWTCEHCNRTAVLCKGGPEYCIKCNTPMNPEFKRQVINMNLQAVPDPIPRNGDLNFNPKQDIDQAQKWERNTRWVPKVKEPKPSSNCAACWKTVQCTWKDKDGKRILRGPSPPLNRDGSARLCGKCDEVADRILSVQKTNVTQEQLNKLGFEHLTEHSSTEDCQNEDKTNKYRQLKAEIGRYFQTQYEVQRSNRLAIRATHLTLLSLKQAYHKISNSHKYEHDTILDIEGTHAMDKKEILHIKTPLGNLVSDKYKHIKERNAIAVKHEEFSKRLAKLTEMLPDPSGHNGAKDLPLEEYREIPEEFTLSPRKAQHRYAGKAVNLSKYLKHQKISQEHVAVRATPSENTQNQDQNIIGWLSWREQAGVMTDNSARSDEQNTTPSTPSTTSEDDERDNNNRKRSNKRRRPRKAKSKPRRTLTNKINRATKGNISQKQIKIALWHVLRLHTTPAKKACVEEQKAIATVRATTTTLITRSYDLFKRHTHPAHDISYATISAVQALNSLQERTEQCRKALGVDLRALMSTTSGLAIHKKGRIYENEVALFPSTTGKQHNIGEIHPDEYHQHRCCAMPWSKLDVAKHASAQDPSNPTNPEHITTELWHQCASAKAAIIQLNRYINKLKLEESRIQEVAHNAMHLKGIVCIANQRNAAKGEHPTSRNHTSNIDNQHRNTQMQGSSDLANTIDKWIALRKQELLSCRLSAEKARERNQKEAGDAAVLLENILRSRSSNPSLYWMIIQWPQPQSGPKTIHVQSKTRTEMMLTLSRDCQIDKTSHTIEFHKGQRDNDGSPKKPIIGIAKEKHMQTVQWMIPARKWNKLMHATHGNGTRPNVAINNAIVAAMSDFQIRGIIDCAREGSKLDDEWRAGRSKGLNIWNSTAMQKIHDKAKEDRERNWNSAYDYLDWKLAMGQPTTAAYKEFRQRLKKAEESPQEIPWNSHLSFPSRAVWQWYNLGRKAIHKNRAAMRIARRILHKTLKDSYWYIRKIRVTELLQKIEHNPANNWHNKTVGSAIRKTGQVQTKQQKAPFQLAGDLLKAYHSTSNGKSSHEDKKQGKNGPSRAPEKSNDQSTKHCTGQHWHITSRNWNKLMHALHGNGTTQDEIQAKQDALTEDVMKAVKGHPGFSGKPLGNLVKWIKQLTATKQFREQCATPAYQKPNALAQYAIQQAQWISEQAGNAWSLKKAAEKGKGNTKGASNKGQGSKGGKGQSKGKTKEKGTPWAQLLFQPVEFEMSREQEPSDPLDDMSDELQPMWTQPPRIEKDNFQHGAQGLAFLTTSDFQAKSRLALEEQNQALAALLPISKNAFEKQFAEEHKGDFASHDWRAQEITLTATNKETQMPELKAALLVQFGGHVVRVRNIKPDVIFKPSDKVEVLVIWEISKYPEQPTREDMKTAVEKATGTGITELYATGPATNRKTQIQYGWQCICKMPPETAAEYMKAAGKNDIYAKYFTRQGKAAPVESTSIPMPTSITKAEAVQLGSTLLGWHGLIHTDRGYAIRIEDQHLAAARVTLRGPNSKYPDPRIDEDTAKIIGKYTYKIEAAQTGWDALGLPKALRGWNWDTRVERIWIFRDRTNAFIYADNPPPHNATTAYPQDSEGKTFPVVITPQNQSAKDAHLTPRNVTGTRLFGGITATDGQGGTTTQGLTTQNGRNSPPNFGTAQMDITQDTVKGDDGGTAAATPSHGKTQDQATKIKSPAQKCLDGIYGPALLRLKQAGDEAKLRDELIASKKHITEREKQIKDWMRGELAEVKGKLKT